MGSQRVGHDWATSLPLSHVDAELISASLLHGGHWTVLVTVLPVNSGACFSTLNHYPVGLGSRWYCLTTYSGVSPPLRVTDGVWDAVLEPSKRRPIRFQLRTTELFSLCLSIFFWLVTFTNISFSSSCPNGKCLLCFWTHAFTSSPISLPTSTNLIFICIPLLAWET